MVEAFLPKSVTQKINTVIKTKQALVVNLRQTSKRSNLYYNIISPDVDPEQLGYANLEEYVFERANRRLGGFNITVLSDKSVRGPLLNTIRAGDIILYRNNTWFFDGNQIVKEFPVKFSLITDFSTTHWPVTAFSTYFRHREPYGYQKFPFHWKSFEDQIKRNHDEIIFSMTSSFVYHGAVYHLDFLEETDFTKDVWWVVIESPRKLSVWND